MRVTYTFRTIAHNAQSGYPVNIINVFYLFTGFENGPICRNQFFLSERESHPGDAFPIPYGSAQYSAGNLFFTDSE